MIEGSVLASRQEGERLLLLFSETHTVYPIIRQNLLNACTLVDGEFVGCVGVEGVYDFEEWTAEDIEAESQRLFAEFPTDAEMIEHFIEEAEEMDQEDPGRPHFYFGNCLKLLRPAVAIKCVETDEHDGEAAQVQTEIITKHAQAANVTYGEFVSWLKDGSNKETTDKAMLEFRNHEINQKRDQAFLANLVNFWQNVDGKKAAILNAGTAHQNRIAGQLTAEFKFVQIVQNIEP